VLTVEDDPIVRMDLRVILEDAGYDVCPEAKDGVEAVELARTHRPDLILIDLGLPRLDGVEATRQILGERDVPIVAVTGHATGAMARQAIEAGAVAHVQKPFHETQLIRAIDGALAEQASSSAPVGAPTEARCRSTISALVVDFGPWDYELGRPVTFSRWLGVFRR
jgi:response regulator NasT